MNQNLLFGGALFAAGIATDASAQNMTLVDSYVVAAALDYDIPQVIFDDAMGAGPIGPVIAHIGPQATAYAICTPALLYAWGSSDDAPVTTAAGALFSTFTVPAAGTVDIVWDWTGAQATGQQNYVTFEDLTAGVLLLSVDFNAGGAQTGAVSFDVDPGVDYRFTGFAYATHNVAGDSFVSLEYTGCPCDLDGNEALNVDDIDLFVAAFVAGDLSVDFDGSGSLNVDDIDAFIACFTAGCS